MGEGKGGRERGIEGESSGEGETKLIKNCYE